MLYAKIINNNVVETITFKELQKRFPHTAFPTIITNNILRPLGYRIVETIPMNMPLYKEMTKETIFEVEVNYNSKTDTAERKYILVPYEEDIEERVKRKWIDIEKRYNNLITKSTEEEKKYKGLFASNFSKFREEIKELLKIEDPFTIHFPSVPDFSIKDLISAKIYKKEELKYKYNQMSNKPRVYVENLDFYVDGARNNLDDFTRNLDDMKKQGITSDTVKDADNNYHTNITQEGFELIINAIFKNGKDLLIWKWEKENQIDKKTTIEEVEEIEI